MLSLLSRLFRPRRSAEPVWIEIDALRDQLATEDRPIALIDVRQPEEFAAPPGHLPGAVNVPLPDLPARMHEIAEQKRPIVLICKTDRRSAQGAALLVAGGVRNVAVLRGGTDGWHRAGLPLD